jgi:hypothetical protein
VVLKGFDEFGLYCYVRAVQMDGKAHTVEGGLVLDV